MRLDHIRKCKLKLFSIFPPSCYNILFKTCFSGNYSHNRPSSRSEIPHDRASIGQISENYEYTEDRKYSISGESFIFYI